MTDSMPVLTDEYRQKLIKTASEDIAFLENVRERRGHLFDLEEEKLTLIKIALASLEAEAVAMRYRHVCEEKWNLERYPKIDNKLTNLIQQLLYTAPPVPALKLPKYADSSNVPFAANGWNAAIDEVKRLNGVIEFKRVEGE